MSNKYTQDMTGTGQYIELPDSDPEPERYYDWILWKLRQSPEWKNAIHRNKEKNKEANRIHYAVKGHLIPDDWSQSDIDKMHAQYIKRLWGNCERLEYTEEPFEKLWSEKYD